MTQHQSTHKPPITDLWLLVDEEQTLRYGMRQAWRWLESEQGAQHQMLGAAQPVRTSAAAARAGCMQRQTTCLAQQPS